MKATIWHNPRCSKSREALNLLEEAGVDLTVIDYLTTPPDRETLARLYRIAGMTAAEGLRTAEAGAKPLAGASESAILAAMVADPAIIERPLVETERGVRLARPPERIREIL